jgi:hypothetical protein
VGNGFDLHRVGNHHAARVAAQDLDNHPGVEGGLQYHLVLCAQRSGEGFNLFLAGAHTELPAALPIRGELADLEERLVYVESVEHPLLLSVLGIGLGNPTAIYSRSKRTRMSRRAASYITGLEAHKRSDRPRCL